MEKTIFYGNGLNMLGDSEISKISWRKLLEELADYVKYPQLNLDNKPYTMIYEELVLKGSLETIEEKRKEEEIKKRIIDKHSKSRPNQYYDKLRDLHLKNYITTNYDLNLEMSFGNIDYSCNHKKLETIYSIRTYVDITKDNKLNSKIWHIHGDIERVKSISLGLDHYCGTIGKMDNYFKGNYNYKSNQEEIRIKALSDKINGTAKFDDISWIDLFFTTDVHIIGLSLDYSETDLWWLLNRRARHKGGYHNKITYYDTVDINERFKDTISANRHIISDSKQGPGSAVDHGPFIYTFTKDYILGSQPFS